MRALLFAVSLLCVACGSVQDTCDADDIECWQKHLEADLDGDPLSASTKFVITDGIPVLVGSSRALLWVVGTNGKIVSRVGTGAWKEEASGSSATLRAVWAAAANDVWAGGDAELLHFDGVAWNRISVGLARIDAISGSAADDVWFAASTNGLVHFDGAGFSSVSTGVTAPIRSVRSIARGDVWAGADDGSLVHGDGNTWTRVTSGVTVPITSLAALSSTDVFFAAGALFRGSATGGFVGVPITPATSPITGVFASNGLVWAVSQAGVVSGPRPDFTATMSMTQPTCAFFDGETAITAGTTGFVERWERGGGSLGQDPTLQPLSNWNAITGVVPPAATDTRVVLTFESTLTSAADGGTPLAPGVRTPIRFTFSDPCGSRPGVCVQLCLRGSRCASGVICRQPLADQRIRGLATLYVKETARGVGAEPELDVHVGAIQWTNDGGVDGRRLPIRITDPAPPPGGTGGGGTGGGTGAGGGTGSCGHCVEGQTCPACSPGFKCGNVCCAPSETCDNGTCRTSASSGRGPATITDCADIVRTPAVHCANGGCCPVCMICRNDGVCALP